MAFYKLALSAPVLLHAVLLFASDRLMGMMLFTLFFGGLPYAVFLVLAFSWSRKKPAAQIRRWLLIAPVWYATVFLGFMLVIALVDVSSLKSELPTIGKGIGLLAAGALVYGYLWVLVTLAAWKLFSRRAKPASDLSRLGT